MSTSEISYDDMVEALFRRSGGMQIPDMVFGRLASSGVLASVQSVLSVSSGTTWADELLISCCNSPNTGCGSGVSRYVMVHADQRMCQTVGDRIKSGFAAIDLSVSNSSFQDWRAEINEEGVSEKFDLIFMYETLYYFSEAELGEILQRCVHQLLAPNGRILISIDTSTYESCFYFSVVRKAWPDKANITVPDSGVLERIFTELHLDDRASFERWFEYGFDIDIQEPYEDAFLSAFTLMMPQSSKEDLKRVMEAIRELANGNPKALDNRASILFISLK